MVLPCQDAPSPKLKNLAKMSMMCLIFVHLCSVSFFCAPVVQALGLSSFLCFDRVVGLRAEGFTFQVECSWFRGFRFTGSMSRHVWERFEVRVWGSVSEVQAQAQAEFTGPGSPVPESWSRH